MRSIPVELEAPAVWSVSPTCSPASLVRALLFVAPNSILPIHDPAMPAASPANSGLRCMNEGCMAGAGWALKLGCRTLIVVQSRTALVSQTVQSASRHSGHRCVIHGCPCSRRAPSP